MATSNEDPPLYAMRCVNCGGGTMGAFNTLLVDEGTGMHSTFPCVIYCEDCGRLGVGRSAEEAAESFTSIPRKPGKNVFVKRLSTDLRLIWDPVALETYSVSKIAGAIVIGETLRVRLESHSDAEVVEVQIAHEPVREAVYELVMGTGIGHTVCEIRGWAIPKPW